MPDKKDDTKGSKQGADRKVGQTGQGSQKSGGPAKTGASKKGDEGRPAGKR